ncbi:MAG: cytochrome c biogenesis protein CcsA [Desulfovibrio sp.]|nr:cytochrome c biogenesis protein CcsA [Desulfovibrio sp.]
MISPDLSTGVALALYSGAVITGIFGMLARRLFWSRCGCILAFSAFAFQTLTLALGFHKALPGGLTAGAYFQLMAWFVVLCALIALVKLRQPSTLIFAATLGLMLFVMSTPYLTAVVRLPETLSTAFYALHIGTLFLSLALMALAFAAGGLFLFLENRIKSKRSVKGFWQDMPALSLLDRINAFTVIAGYPLYTLGILSGLVWARPVYGVSMTGDPKEIVSIVIWLLFSILFHNRLTRGWRGRKPAQVAVGIFLLCLFSIFVVNTFMNTHHAFIRN